MLIPLDFSTFTIALTHCTRVSLRNEFQVWVVLELKTALTIGQKLNV